MMEKINDEALDVRTIVILICHDHQVAISQGLDIGFIVLNAKLEPKNINDVLDFLIFVDLQGVVLSCGTKDTKQAEVNNSQIRKT